MRPQLHLCVLNFIYASSASLMSAQLHLCLLKFIYASATSFMRPQLHLCLFNFIDVCSTSFMPAQLHLCVLNFIYAFSTSFMSFILPGAQMRGCGGCHTHPIISTPGPSCNLMGISQSRSGPVCIEFCL